MALLHAGALHLPQQIALVQIGVGWAGLGGGSWVRVVGVLCLISSTAGCRNNMVRQVATGKPAAETWCIELRLGGPRWKQ